jgi:hypothetical protein
MEAADADADADPTVLGKALKTFARSAAGLVHEAMLAYIPSEFGGSQRNDASHSVHEVKAIGAQR